MQEVIDLLEDALDTMINETKIPEYYQEVSYIREAINVLEDLAKEAEREKGD